MFTLNKEDFNEFDINKARKFVNFWSGYYHDNGIKSYNSDEAINYIKELNLKHKLTEQNVKRLLRWKDPRMLTENILSGTNEGEKNKRVIRVVENLEKINDFRFCKIDEEEFQEETNKIFPDGFIWSIFLFHIARPFEYPIADRNVFCVYSVQTKTEVPKDWNGYLSYIDYFFKISISSGVIQKKPKGNEYNIKEIVFNLKKVDNALLSFGQFLNNYGSTGILR